MVQFFEKFTTKTIPFDFNISTSKMQTLVVLNDNIERAFKQIDQNLAFLHNNTIRKLYTDYKSHYFQYKEKLSEPPTQEDVQNFQEQIPKFYKCRRLDQLFFFYKIRFQPSFALHLFVQNRGLYKKYDTLLEEIVLAIDQDCTLNQLIMRYKKNFTSIYQEGSKAFVFLNEEILQNQIPLLRGSKNETEQKVLAAVDSVLEELAL